MDLNLNNILNTILTESVSFNHVKQAIDDKRIVKIKYDDTQENPPLGDRWIEPCSIVDMGKPKYNHQWAGNGFAVRAYVWGDSRRGGVPDWRLFKLDRIVSWTPTSSHFTYEPDSRFNPNGDKQYEVVYMVDFGGESDMIKRNLQITAQDNERRGRDSLGKKIKKQNTPQQNQSGPINTPQTPDISTQQQQQGPIYTQDVQKQIDQMYADRDSMQNKQKQKDLSKAWDALAHKQKRQRERANAKTALTKNNKIGDNGEIRSKDYEETPEYLEYLKNNNLAENKILKEIGYK